MRINSSTTWVLLASTLGVVAVEDWPAFNFDGRTFQGEMFWTQSSVFQYEKISKGAVFNWTQTGAPVDVVRVDLMNKDNVSIIFWCSDNSCVPTEGFEVFKEAPQIHLESGVMEILSNSLDKPLFFRVDWQLAGGKRDIEKYSSYSQEWAIVENLDDAGNVFSSNSLQMTAGASAAYPPNAAPTIITSASTSAGSSGTTASTTSVTTTPSAAAATGNSGTKSRALTTGAIVGIVVGCVGGVILVSVVAGCLCFRRRRIAGDERGGSRGVQDIAAEKEAHASILDKDQPDTPYSEQNSQHPLHRGLGLAGRNESGVDLAIGQAISGERSRSVRTESLHTVTAGNDRNSGMYSSLGGAANSAHGTPVMGSGAFAGGGHNSPRAQTHTPTMSVHDRSSAMGSPVPRSSSQLDRSLSPYRDNAGQLDYVQQQHHHRHVVDGADLVQQEHSNDSTARSPSSLYSNPLDELQPISPESARESSSGAAGAGGGGGGGASGQAGRSNTPSGIAQQYAHLVEEGMTDAEIRRLEEEERALDEAIEAQVGGTSGRQR